MRIGEYLKKRRANWSRLERLLSKSEKVGSAGRLTGEEATQLADDYRSTCSDLAMVDEYRLPSTSARYLHNLVARSHNRFYGNTSVYLDQLIEAVLRTAPRRILNDPCVQICSLIFFGLFIMSALASYAESLFPQYAVSILGQETINELEKKWADKPGGEPGAYLMASAYYIQHNTSIGLRCFAEGILILPMFVELGFNAVYLGANFGFMARENTIGGENFFIFTTAHGPFELTAIVLSAAAGLRLGLGLFITNGLSRLYSLKESALRSLPIVLTAVVLFILAAFTEGCISTSPLPYFFKAFWAVMSSSLMMLYFVALGSIADDEAENAA